MMRLTHSLASLALGALCLMLPGCDSPTEPRPVIQIIAFTAQWCGPCHRQRPQLAELAAAGYALETIDIDDQPAEADRHHIHSVPTYLLLIDGQETFRTHHATDLQPRLRSLP